MTEMLCRNEDGTINRLNLNNEELRIIEVALKLYEIKKRDAAIGSTTAEQRDLYEVLSYKSRELRQKLYWVYPEDYDF